MDQVTHDQQESSRPQARTATEDTKLIKLSASGDHIATNDVDIRGRTVKDREGQEIGTVDDLLIALDNDRVRFLIVGSGGFLGIGRDTLFLPVEAVGHVGDEVLVEFDTGRLAASPGYDPELTSDRDYYTELYGYYGYTPYWGPGYVYPGYPYF